MSKQIIAIPLGDPAGIGPEITVKSLEKQEIYDVCKPLVIGDKSTLKNAMEFSNVDLEINSIESPEKGLYQQGTIDCISLDNVDSSKLQIGEVSASSGKAAFEYIETAINLAMENQVGAIATTPINKESLQAAEVPYIGHTEMLEGLTDTQDPLTMFEVRSMRIFFLTRHVSLKQAIDQINPERVHNYLVRCDEALDKLGVSKADRTIAVAGLNPHASENGLFGNEEAEGIIPGIESAKESGVDAVGPVPADSVFHHALNGKYAAVLSLYHDQGHIAAKMTDFEKTVSITNGLPFLRTSVDHGTAFDIAGKGIASSVSMEECIKLAAKYSETFRK
ncbi:4-hydroxythreonine-4-phosphate dehydrogenase PdxA [Halalkalibacillus halophilus]|uniref:4-hydroxythreonine-4-phosphate dehydrogenase PdxA n=1 Tax=Halalkalibacillus halophilus TaxID=392827 RepID=UPI000419FD45|nr:4-hydroxythreonine-4-phosphate dehydrogenase PdxA [Halalkalibacillus halophilus]